MRLDDQPDPSHILHPKDQIPVTIPVQLQQVVPETDERPLRLRFREASKKETAEVPRALDLAKYRLYSLLTPPVDLRVRSFDLWRSAADRCSGSRQEGRVGSLPWRCLSGGM